MKNRTAVIILAAGKGERMRSDIPKALHPLCGRPMIEYVLDLARALKPQKAVAVLGYKHQEFRKYIGRGVKISVQRKLLGTADAVRTGLSALGNFNGQVLILYADIPLLKKETIEKLLKQHTQNRADATLLVAVAKKPFGYGRILRDKYASICGIVEEKDADDFQKEIKEVNTGIICCERRKLAACLKEVRLNRRKKEFYLTDVIGIFYKKGYLIEGLKLPDLNEAQGINSRKDLSAANRAMQQRVNEKLMEEGVSIVDSPTAFISYGAKVGKETTIYPFTVIEKDVRIGKHCSVGPFAHLRDGTRLGDGVVAGNFLETVRAELGDKTLAKHFCYLGDTRIGRQVNIGAGTVTANFDGRKKHKTVIEEKALIGSDTVFVAPVKVGRRALTGAGAVVVKNVPSQKTVVGVPAKEIKKQKRG
jgi:bifunctional UDP-N-acetylglucosamine pyrophosphorylase/glucosamine-1-phosphate N-acetyltransferase